MTKQEAISAVYQGNIVECSKEEYSQLRTAIQEQAGKWIDQNQHLRAQIALMEVKRLDEKFNFSIQDVAKLEKAPLVKR